MYITWGVIDSPAKIGIILYYVDNLLNDKKRNLQKNNEKTNICTINLTLVKELNLYKLYDILLNSYV